MYQTQLNLGATMTEKYEECPNGCSSAGEVWNGDGLVLCPTCKGDTTVVEETIDAPDRLWVDPTGVDELDMYVAHASDTMDYLNMDVSYTRTDSILSELRANIPPLVWSDMDCGEYKCETRLFFGRIYRNNDDCWTLDDGEGYSAHATLEAAQAAANTHHRDAIMIALTGEKT
jgi:hypothetical protein